MSTSRYRRILSPPFITNFDQSWKQLLSCLDSPAGLPDDIPHPMTHNPVSLALNHQDSVPLSQRAKQTCLCVRDNREISKALEQVKVEKKSIHLLSFNRADLKNMLIVNYAVRILDIVYARLCFCLLSFFWNSRTVKQEQWLSLVHYAPIIILLVYRLKWVSYCDGIAWEAYLSRCKSCFVSWQNKKCPDHHQLVKQLKCTDDRLLTKEPKIMLDKIKLEMLMVMSTIMKGEIYNDLLGGSLWWLMIDSGVCIYMYT